MSEVDNSLVRQGFWINYSEGHILGATLTTDQRVANIVVAIMAIVVAAAAGSAWNLVMFSWHQLRGTSQLRDGLFRQQQILFRTMAPPSSVFVESLKLLWIWRKDTRSWHNAQRWLPVLTISFVFGIASLAASISSSYVISTTDLEVLVDGSTCRNVNISAYGGAPIYYAPTTLDTSVVTSSRSYADECYGGGSLPPRCRIYVHPRIATNASTGPCPFNPSMCRLKGALEASMTLDSGYLDSNDHFGINSPPKDRVQLRRLATCAPIDTTKYLQTHDGNETGLYLNLNYDYTTWYLGKTWTWNFGPQDPPKWPGNGSFGYNSIVVNTTYSMSIK